MGTLQSEIKQTRPFATVEQEAAVGLLRTAAMLEHATNELLRPLELTSTQYNVLRILKGAGQGGLCGREVGERMIARVPDVPRMLERMEGAGLVQRERDATDRRHVTVRLTATGRRKLDRATEALDALEHRFLRRLGKERLAGLIEALDAIRSG